MQGLVSRRFEVGESRGIVMCDEALEVAKSVGLIKDVRAEIEAFISCFPEFRASLEPWSWEDVGRVPGVIKRMIDATVPFGVGPMAAVAGAIIDEVYERLGGGHVANFVMENGGEILVRASRPVTIGLYAGKAALGSRVGFVVPPGDVEISAIASSSATIGHAFSFGNADVVTVFCGNATVADAAATALCNLTTSSDAGAAVMQAVEGSKRFPSVTGVFVVMKDRVGMAGRLPELVNLTGEERDLIDITLH